MPRHRGAVQATTAAGAAHLRSRRQRQRPPSTLLALCGKVCYRDDAQCNVGNQVASMAKRGTAVCHAHLCHFRVTS